MADTSSWHEMLTNVKNRMHGQSSQTPIPPHRAIEPVQAPGEEYQPPPGLFRRLFPTRDETLEDQHRYERRKAELEAGTTAYKMDIAHALENKEVIQADERRVVKYSSGRRAEIEMLKADGYADLMIASVFKELVQEAQHLGLDPLQANYLAEKWMRRFYPKPEETGDGDEG